MLRNIPAGTPAPPLIAQDAVATSALSTGRDNVSERRLFYYQLSTIGAGLFIAILVLGIACYVQLPVSCTTSVSMLIGSAAFCVYGFFAWYAWQHVLANAAVQGDIMQQSATLQHIRRVAWLAVGSAVASPAFAIGALLHVLSQWKNLVDWRYVTTCSAEFFLALPIMLSMCNPDALMLVPWQGQHHNGLPTVTAVTLCAVGTCLTDLLQIGTQAYFIILLCDDNLAIERNGVARDADEYQLLLSTAFAISLVCCAVAFASLWSRGLRKVKLLCCSHQGSPSQADEFWLSAAAAAAAYASPTGPESRGTYGLDDNRDPKVGLHDSATRSLTCADSMPLWQPGAGPPAVAPVPRGAAMRWLYELEGGAPSPAPAPASRSPLASSHEGGVAVEGEEPSAAASHIPQLVLTPSLAGVGQSIPPQRRRASHEGYLVRA